MPVTTLGRSAAIVAIALAFSVPALAAQKETETVNKTVALPAHGTLKLRNFSGRVNLTPASGNDVIIKAVRTAEREQLDHIKLEIETTGSTVSIDANKRDAGWDERNHKDNVVRTDFDIQVPVSAMLDVYGFSSDLDIRGITGDQKLETFSGDITMEGAKGSVEAKTFSGRIDINLTGAGAAPAVSAETFSANIRVHLADNAKGEVSFDSFSGRFESDLPLTVRSIGRHRTSGDLPGGSGGSTLKFHTFSGDVRVTK